MFRLYIKTHNVSTLKYLGYTTQDPETYAGSGTRWLNHLRIHGNNVTTEVIYETDDKNDLIAAGLYYSSLYQIVESDDWANIVNEDGSGSSEAARMGGYARRDRRANKSSFKPGHVRSKESIEKQRKTMTGKKRGSYNTEQGKPVVVDGVWYKSVQEARRATGHSYYTVMKKNTLQSR